LFSLRCRGKKGGGAEIGKEKGPSVWKAKGGGWVYRKIRGTAALSWGGGLATKRRRKNKLHQKPSLGEGKGNKKEGGRVVGDAEKGQKGCVRSEFSSDKKKKTSQSERNNRFPKNTLRYTFRSLMR